MSPIERTATASSSAGGLVSLFDSTLAGAAATIDTGANGIASGHGDLIICLYARSSGAAFGDNVNFFFNNDLAANYDVVEMSANGGAITAPSAFAHAGGIICNIPGASGTASYFGIGRMTVTSYDAVTAGFKVTESAGGFTYGVITNAQQQQCICTWRSTAAISRLSMNLGTGGNFLLGSRLVVYGTK